jgi:hypothetical protein
MAGAYCRFCGHRCFVLRVLPDRSWSGHMATCAAGMTHDRKATGYDHTTAGFVALGRSKGRRCLSLAPPRGAR